MKISIVLAVAVVFGLLRFLRVSLLMWAGAWWAGIYILLRFGFTAPIPSSVITIYMGIVSIAILAYVSSSEQRREEVSGPLVRFMTEKRYTALLAATVVAVPALAAANVYVQDERSPRAAALLADRASRIAGGHHGSRQEDRSRCRREPLPCISRSRTRRSSAHRSRTGARSTIRTASSATATTWPATACSRTGWTRSRPTSTTPSRSFARRFSSGGSPRGARDFLTKAVPGTRPCPPGRSS